jgi:hypothetical protein
VKEEYFGKTLFNILARILNNFNIRNRILAVTINNAFNNNTFMENLNQKFRKSITEIFGGNSVVHIPYLTHIIQLTAKIIMGRLKIEIKNNSKKVNWEGDKAVKEIKKAKEIAKTLAKIYHDQYNDLTDINKIFLLNSSAL